MKLYIALPRNPELDTASLTGTVCGFDSLAGLQQELLATEKSVRYYRVTVTGEVICYNGYYLPKGSQLSDFEELHPTAHRPLPTR